MNNSTSSIWVLYHANCLDGYASAWSAWKFFGNMAHYQPVRHRMPVPKIPKGATIYLLDFCYPMEQMLMVASNAHQVIVLDHHASTYADYIAHRNQADLPVNLAFYFEQTQSGCVMAWNYFFPDSAMPVLLAHIQDRDLWLHQLSGTAEITHALYSLLPIPFSDFEQIEFTELYRKGSILHKQHQLHVKRLLTSHHKIVLNGVIGLAANAPMRFSSELGEALAKISGTYGLVYRFHEKRRLYECSLRSIGEFDVSALAVHFGGGGHRNAAGFSVIEMSSACK